MEFDFNQILVDYFNITSLDDYDIDKKQLLQNDDKFFTTSIIKLTYNLTLLKNNILYMIATSKICFSQEFSLIDQGHVKKIYESKCIDFATINYFKTTELVSEFKSYAITIRKKITTSDDTALKFFLQIQQNKTNIYTTPFAESFITEYKLNKNIKYLYSTLKNHLKDSYKEDFLLPKRDDQAYKKIDSFKSYELTYKIFYEMAIRNYDVKKIMSALDYLYDIRGLQKKEIRVNRIDCIVNNDEKTYKLSGSLNTGDIPKDTKVFTSINDSKLQCVETIKDNKFEVEILQNKDTQDLDLFITIGADNYQTNQMNFGLPITHSEVSIRTTATGISKNNKETTTSIKIGTQKYSIKSAEYSNWTLLSDNNNDIYNSEILINKYKDFLNPDEHKIYFSRGIFFINELIKELEAELIDTYHIYPKNYDVDHPEKSEIFYKRLLNNALDLRRLKDDPTYIHQDKYFFKQDEYDGYSIHQGILTDEDKRYSISTIKQDTTKQVVDYNISNLQINLNIPKQELLDYLSKVKDNYDNDNSILLSPIELMGQDAVIEPEYIRNMNSSKWANVFYIYDTTEYSTSMQKKLEKEKKKLTDKLNKELLPYNKAGPKTLREKTKIRQIEKKYNIRECEKEIDDIGKTLEAKYTKLSREINLSQSSIRSLIKLMQFNIGKTKYKQYLRN